MGYEKDLQRFKWQSGNIYWNIFLNNFATFLRVAFMVPSPLGYGFAVILILAAIIFIFALVQMTRGFYVEVGEDSSLNIVRGLRIRNLSQNTLKFVGRNTVCASISRDNIVSVSEPTEADMQLIEKWHPQSAIVTVNPIKKFQYGMQIMKNWNLISYDNQNGFGPYSLAFATDQTKLIKISLRHLTVQSGFNSSSVLKEYKVDNPIIYVSLKQYKDFLSSRF